MDNINKKRPFITAKASANRRLMINRYYKRIYYSPANGLTHNYSPIFECELLHAGK